MPLKKKNNIRYDDWRDCVSSVTENEAFRKNFFLLKQQQRNIEPFVLKVTDTVSKATKQKEKILKLITLGDDIKGGHHVLQTAEAEEKLVLFDSLFGAVYYQGGPKEKSNPVCVQSDMDKGDIICHQYSFCEALHFVDPERYSKPNWKEGNYDRVANVEEELRIARQKKKPEKEIKKLVKKLIREEKGQNNQKVYNFKIVLKTIKKLVKDSAFLPAFQKTWQSHGKETIKGWLEEFKQVVKVMRAKDVLDF
jgi:hypothetical protein